MSGVAAEMELRRLWLGRADEPPPHDYRPFEMQATGPAADAILLRVREVMTIVLMQDPSNWPEVEEWRAVLPAWFVERSAAEETELEARERLARMRSLSPEERAEQERREESQPWTVSAFVHWFLPANRQWWWWAADSAAPGLLRILLIVEETPVADEALDWLLRAAGAEEVANESLLRARRRASPAG